MANASCPKCGKTKFDMSNTSIANANTGLIYCTNCGCVVGISGGPFHWNMVKTDLQEIKNQLAAIRAKVAPV
jgi:transcription initiation factor TFIIIB Brf1 subunit/transcription initiation factor TFIIB